MAGCMRLSQCGWSSRSRRAESSKGVVSIDHQAGEVTRSNAHHISASSWWRLRALDVQLDRGTGIGTEVGGSARCRPLHAQLKDPWQNTLMAIATALRAEGGKSAVRERAQLGGDWGGTLVEWGGARGGALVKCWGGARVCPSANDAPPQRTNGGLKECATG